MRFPGKFDLFVGLHFTCHLKIMLSFYSEYLYFVRTTKAAFQEDRERVKSCLWVWDMKIADYKMLK